MQGWLVCHAGKSTLRMAELAALALRALTAGNALNQDAARASGAAPLLVVLLNPTQNRFMAEERKARKENAAAASARAMLALVEGNEVCKVMLFLAWTIEAYTVTWLSCKHRQCGPCLLASWYQQIRGQTCA